MNKSDLETVNRKDENIKKEEELVFSVRTEGEKTMKKLDFKSFDDIENKLSKIAEAFPNTVIEVGGGGGVNIDFDLLKQELSSHVIEGAKERYQLTWPGKKQAILEAGMSTTKTLRPLYESSVDFGRTENVYIEGDNLEVLKILQESYLNKIKVIYIDPPYNTGKDFIYKDNFNKNSEDELKASGQVDENNNRLVVNTESNGRYHSDWLSMMYPRLKLARNLLKEDGVIFISIDDNEVCNLRKICEEIFGENNFIGDIIRKTKSTTNDNKTGFNIQHENTLIFAKSRDLCFLRGEVKAFENYKNPDNDPNGEWVSADPSARTGSNFEIKNPYTGKIDLPPGNREWLFSKETFYKYVESGKIKFKEEYGDNERGFILKRYKNEVRSDYGLVNSLVGTDNLFMNQAATKQINKLFPEFKAFDYTKPTEYIKKLINYSTDASSIVLDFFSGSATTAHAVMQANFEDGGKRKYIMVQLPEKTDEKSEAYRLGYCNICSIGQERIRRAGKQIKEETNADIDYGFRVYKVDSSNMKDVYFKPNKLNQMQLGQLESNIKEDRTSEDLLTSVLLDLGLSLDLKFETKEILGSEFMFVEGNSLVACFDADMKLDVIDEVCKVEPLRLVFREACFITDADKINVAERIKKLSPITEIHVL